MFMTRSLNVTPKATDQYLISRSDLISSLCIASNKRLRSTFCTIEAKYQCSSRKWKGTVTPSAERGWGWGGVSPSPYPLPNGEKSGQGAVPPPQNFFFDLLSDSSAFWCNLGACFNVSITRVKQSRKAVLCANCQLVSYLTRRTYHPWYHTHKNIYQSQQANQLDNRRTCMENYS